MKLRLTALLAAITVFGCTTDNSTPGADRTTLVPGPGTFGYDFAKDGRLTFSKFVNGKAAVYVANGDGTAAKRVSFGVCDAGPRWLPDGNFISVERDERGHWLHSRSANPGGRLATWMRCE